MYPVQRPRVRMMTVCVEASGCEQLAQSRYALRPDTDRNRNFLMTSLTPYTFATPRHHTTLSISEKACCQGVVFLDGL